MTSRAGKTGVLVVTHNQCEVTSSFIRNFQSTFRDDWLYLLVLDNNSSDGTIVTLRERFPTVDIRQLNDNYGCVTGRNIGIVELDKLECDFVYISDNDIVIEDGRFFEKMRVFMQEHLHIDGCCPVVRWADDHTVQTLGGRRVSKNRTRNVTTLSSNVNVDTLPGCAQYVRMTSFKRYGLYDNDLTPLSLEDYEWGMRATELGAKLCHNPDTEVLHFHDRMKRESSEKIRHLITGRMVYLRKRFSLSRLIQEVQFVLSIVMRYGISFVVQSYIHGARKVITGGNFDFYSFAQQGLKTFAKED